MSSPAAKGTVNQAKADDESPGAGKPPRPSEQEREILRFSPDPSQTSILESFDRIPTFLFRLHAPSTVGTTNTDEVSSPACSRAGSDRRDLFQLGKEDAARRINDHLWWDPSHQAQCNLMSWSSSLLFLLQYGLYRHVRDFGKPALSDIYVLMVDTRGFPNGTFVRDLELINEFERHFRDDAKKTRDKTLQRVKEFRLSNKYFGEYLSQGRLRVKGHCCQGSMRQLIDLGLFKLCPGLENSVQWTGWVKIVVEIRYKFRNQTVATDKTVLRTAVTIAQACFGGRWALPVTAMLLSLQPRRHNDETILDAFRSLFSGEPFYNIPKILLFYSSLD